MVDRANSLAMPENRVVQVEDLTVRFVGAERTVEAVRNLSFHVDRGETLAIVGESGSGKSVTSLALMRLVEHGGGRIAQGRIALRRRNGDIVDLGASSQRAMRSVRGADMAMIFQEPMTSLNPVFTAGEQIAETIRLHQARTPRPRAPRRCACSSRCAFPRRGRSWTVIRTSFPAACASA